jgi:uncharacterized membrane protein YdjX (TVP38/TMEM64 family)
VGPIDPALAEALTTAGFLILGGVVVVPRAVVCMGAGAVLGWSALWPAMAGTAIGTTLGFVLARFVFRGFVQRFAAARPRIQAVMRAIDAEGWRLIGLLRLASPVPGPVINFACGVTGIAFGDYITASVLGVLPQTLLFIYLGKAGTAALASRSLFGVDSLTAAAGVALTVAALWRLKLAARQQSARMLVEADATTA